MYFFDLGNQSSRISERDAYLLFTQLVQKPELITLPGVKWARSFGINPKKWIGEYIAPNVKRIHCLLRDLFQRTWNSSTRGSRSCKSARKSAWWSMRNWTYLVTSLGRRCHPSKSSRSQKATLRVSKMLRNTWKRLEGLSKKLNQFNLFKDSYLLNSFLQVDRVLRSVQYQRYLRRWQQNDVQRCRGASATRGMSFDRTSKRAM